MNTFRATYQGIDPQMNGRIGTAWPLDGESNPASHNFDAYGFQPDGEEWAGICGSDELTKVTS